MTDAWDAATRLWTGLEGLARGLPPEGRTVPTVRVCVDGGAVFEVFRADRVPAAVVAWRVRAFTEDGVRVAAILGTADGRATLTTASGQGGSDAPPVGGLVLDASPGERDISDLSEAIAAAVRALMGPEPRDA